MTALNRIAFTTRDRAPLRGDFFRAENANAPIVLMLGGLKDAPDERPIVGNETAPEFWSSMASDETTDEIK
jgi:hypothetical protein